MHYEALQAPSYIHEVHLLAVTMVSDLMDLERRAREGVKLIIAHFEEEEERERVIGGTERADAIDRIRRGKQLVPVRRRYRTQADRDEMALAKLAISEGSLPDNDQNRDKDKDSDSDSDSAGDDNSLDVKGTSVEDTLLDTAIGDTTSSGLSLSLDNLAASRHNSSVWAVNLVDVYTCPRTQQISHAFQVTYCSLTRPIGRTVADRYRERVERDLPIYLGMVPRVVKHGGLVSLSYPWYVTSAVRTILASSSSNSPLGPRNSESKSDESIMASEVDVSDLSIILRELERQERSPASSESPRDLVIGAGVGASALNVAGSDDAPASSAVDSISEDQLDGREKIRTIARSLWRRRVGVLMQADFKSVPSTLPKA